MHSHKILWTLSFILIFVMWLGNFIFLLSNSGFHSNEFRKLGVNETIGSNVVEFVNGRAALSTSFNEQEAAHLEDVRKILLKARIVYYVSLSLLLLIVIYLFVTRKFNYIIPQAFVNSGLTSLLLLLPIFIFSFSFPTFFSLIHRPFFASGTWLFPADSLVIQTFPEQFFKDFTFNLIRLIFVNSAVFFGIGLFVRKKFKRQLQNVLK